LLVGRFGGDIGLCSGLYRAIIAARVFHCRAYATPAAREKTVFNSGARVKDSLRASTPSFRPSPSKVTNVSIITSTTRAHLQAAGCARRLVAPPPLSSRSVCRGGRRRERGSLDIPSGTLLAVFTAARRAGRRAEDDIGHRSWSRLASVAVSRMARCGWQRGRQQLSGMRQGCERNMAACRRLRGSACGGSEAAHEAAETLLNHPAPTNFTQLPCSLQRSASL